jgi:hypothetical protein
LRELFFGRFVLFARVVPTPVVDLGGFLRFCPRTVDILLFFTGVVVFMKEVSSSLHRIFSPATQVTTIYDAWMYGLRCRGGRWPSTCRARAWAWCSRGLVCCAWALSLRLLLRLLWRLRVCTAVARVRRHPLRLRLRRRRPDCACWGYLLAVDCCPSCAVRVSCVGAQRGPRLCSRSPRPLSST